MEIDKELQWVLIDFFDVVMHIFLEDVRSFYDIEHLWHEAKKVRLTKKILE
jgi:ribosome-associated protein